MPPAQKFKVRHTGFLGPAWDASVPLNRAWVPSFWGGGVLGTVPGTGGGNGSWADEGEAVSGLATASGGGSGSAAQSRNELRKPCAVTPGRNPALGISGPWSRQSEFARTNRPRLRLFSTATAASRTSRHIS